MECGILAYSLSNQGCAPALKETRQDVDSIDWDCNPILPMPAKDCYTGTNMTGQNSERLCNLFETRYGIRPTFLVTGGRFGARNNHLYSAACRNWLTSGVVPVVRYVIEPFEGYRPIIKGKYDDNIRLLAEQCASVEGPLVFIPFEQPNLGGHKPWGGYPGNQYVDAWVHMHELFEQEGANKNTIWSNKLKIGSWANYRYPDPFPYCPPKEYIDIIGWQLNNHCKPEIGLDSQSFKSLFDYYYKRAAKKFRTKPQMFWELSSATGSHQDEWLDKALTLITNKYFRVKGVMLDEETGRGGSRYGTFYPHATPESKKVIRKHFTSPYYIGSIIKK